MGTILESTKELAKRFGVENEEQTIKDQIDAITESIDQNFNGSVDIASAVSEFAKNDNPDARLGTKSITENGTYTALDDELDGYSSVTVNVAGGGGETFEVNVTYTNSTTYSSDKTYSEIETAVNSGKNVKCKFTWIMSEETVVLNSYGMIKQEVYEAGLENPVHYFTFALEQFMYAQGPAFPSFAISDFNGTGFLSIKVADALNPV